MRLVYCLFTMLFACPLFASNLPPLDPKLASMFYVLWEDSAFGKNPGRIERATWILKEESGDYGSVKWPTSGDRNHEFWHGPVPKGTVAQAHTHPINLDPRPSRKDVQLCVKTGIPFYTISGKGIWIVTREGSITRIADSNWYKSVKLSEHP